MEFKSVKDMKSRYVSSSINELTDGELKWLNDLKTKVKYKIDEIYNDTPHINFLSVYSNKIPMSAVLNGGSEKLFREIESLETKLRYLGYNVSSEFSYNRGLADEYALYLSWELK